MKKIFVFAYLFILFHAVYARGFIISFDTLHNENTKCLNIYTNDNPVSPALSIDSEKGEKYIQRRFIGSSSNIYSVYYPSQNCLQYIPELDMLAFFHRQNHNLPGNNGFIQASYSINEGQTWENQIIYHDLQKLGHFPSGVIYNPTANSQVHNAYAIVAGPYEENLSWAGNYFSSRKLDGSSYNPVQLSDMNIDYLNQVYAFMDLDSQGRIRVLGNRSAYNGSLFTTINAVVYTGLHNTVTGSWDWSEYLHTPDFLSNNSGLPEGKASSAMAWSSDGETGYLIFIGRHTNSSDTAAFFPIVYKTTDVGQNWMIMPDTNWSLMPVINSYLTHTHDNPHVKRAVFEPVLDAIVDASDNLHFSVYIKSALTTHPDSLKFTHQYAKKQGHMFHCRYSDNGWKAELIDTQWSKDVDVQNSFIGTGWNNRLQMAKTLAEDKIVFAWLDTDTLFSWYNQYPDIKLQVFNLNTESRTPTKNITTSTYLDANNYFMYLSRWAGYDNHTNKIIPYITTTDFGTTNNDPSYHYFLQGITMESLDMTYNINICLGDTLTWRGMYFYSTGVYYDSVSIDSIYILNLTVNPTYYFEATEEICQGDTIYWQNNYYNLEGTYYANYQTLMGCDSTYVLYLHLKPVYEFITEETICKGDTVEWRGMAYTEPGTYYNYFHSHLFCDSIYKLQLNNAVNLTITQTSATLISHASQANIQWVDCNNNYEPIVVETGHWFVPEVNGSYAAIITQNNCTDTTYCFEFTNVGVVEFLNPDKEIYWHPNPNNGIFNLTLDEATKVTVFCTLGKEIYNKKLAKGKHVITLNITVQGIYLLKTQSSRITRTSKLIIKE